MSGPPLKGLDDRYAKPLLVVATAIAQDGYDYVRITERADEHADTLAPACRVEADLRAMATELDVWVRWWRAPAYGLAYVFQHLTRRLQSDAHTAAALLFCDAQIACASDMSLSSAEVAWRASAGHDLATALDRLQLHHTFYARWSKPFDYLACDPLSAHLLNLRDTQRLRRAWPEVEPALRIGTSPDEASARLASTAEAAKAAGDLWSWLVARRIHAVHRPHAEGERLLQGCLDDARRLGLESEIGHLLRLRAWRLKLLGRPAEAAALLRTAVAHETPAALFGYWRGLSLRELGDVLVDQVRVHQPEGDALQGALAAAVDAYAEGRRVLDIVLRTGGPIVGATVKRQMLRSYADNALRIALEAGRGKDALAEMEATGPCELAESFAEVRAAMALPAEDAERFLRSRAVFARHFTSVPEAFEAYEADLPRDYELRHTYQERRAALTLGPGLGSDAAVDRLMATGSDRLFLCFFLGPRYTSHAMLLEPSTGGMLTQELGSRDEELRAAYREYRQAIAGGSADSTVTRPALDRLLHIVEVLLRPVLSFLATGNVMPTLTIVPRLELTGVPFHALRAGDRRLIDVCANITVIPSLGLAAQLLEMGPWHADDRGVTVLEAPSAPVFAGTARRLASVRQVRRVDDPTPAEAIDAMGGAVGADVLLGCHGTFDPDHPERGSLGVGTAGPLAMSDVAAGLAIPRSRSIALGACESGAVRSRLGSEYLGLAGALLSAGARSVTASLWPVNKVSTAILLGECLAQLGADEPPASALKAAQLAVQQMPREEVEAWGAAWLPEAAAEFRAFLAALPDPPFAHPDDWASFFVAGVH